MGCDEIGEKAHRNAAEALSKAEYKNFTQEGDP